LALAARVTPQVVDLVLLAEQLLWLVLNLLFQHLAVHLVSAAVLAAVEITQPMLKALVRVAAVDGAALQTMETLLLLIKATLAVMVAFRAVRKAAVVALAALVPIPLAALVFPIQ
jgi:hypothetical protein